jgi:hypothetical protein
MARTKLPAPGNRTVREALDLLRPSMGEIGSWLRSTTGSPLSRGTLNNYRDGRRAMPKEVRLQFARHIRKHAARLAAVSSELERIR